MYIIMKSINLNKIFILITLFISISLYAQDKMVIINTSENLTPDQIKGPYHKVTDSITVNGYMNHYTVESNFGNFLP